MRRTGAAQCLPAVHSLQAALTCAAMARGRIGVDGELRARLRQTCVVTLEEFDSELVEPIDVRFAPPPEEPGPGRDARRAEEPSPEQTRWMRIRLTR